MVGLVGATADLVDLEDQARFGTMGGASPGRLSRSNTLSSEKETDGVGLGTREPWNKRLHNPKIPFVDSGFKSEAIMILMVSSVMICP